jgi:alpha-tubulin suppressor-like RCC1 family protein
VVAWGNNSQGQLNIPTGLENVVSISAGGNHNLAIKSDGTVVAWGDFASGQTAVPDTLSNVVAVSAGGAHSLALKEDGTIVAWGSNLSNQVNPIPAGTYKLP